MEIVIAVAIVFGIVVYAIKTPPEQRNGELFKWIAFGANTAIVFGFCIQSLRYLWSTVKLWAILVLLLTFHVGAGWMVLRGVERVPLVWYVPVSVLQISVYCFVVNWLLAPKQAIATDSVDSHPLMK